MKLLLFDIDLTLITTAGAGRAAMTRAFQRLFGVSEGLDGVSFAGRTDVAIFKDALRTLELPWSEQREDDFKRLYFVNLREELAKPNSHKHVKPGVTELLQALENRPDVVLGLLTGNWRRGAELKLRHFHLWHYFKLGAFADDSEFRDRLPEVASRRFLELTDRPIPPRNIFVIGDTPLDVACARPFGARSVAVATGFFSYEELQEAGPDFLLRDLSDRATFLNLVIGRN